jgi:nitrite reductase (NO-forming)
MINSGAAPARTRQQKGPPRCEPVGAVPRTTDTGHRHEEDDVAAGTQELVASPDQEKPATEDPAGPQNIRRYWIVRLLFGLIWGIDATLKWLPGFRDHFLAMIQASGQGQPSWLSPFFHFAASAVRPAPGLFAVLTALAETAICLSLLLGVAQRAGFVFGAVFGLAIWGAGEGFGGPYMSGSTDIGCAVMYSVLFAALLLAVPRAVRAAAPSLDSRIVGRWPRLAPLTFIKAS